MVREKRPVELTVTCACGCGTLLPPKNSVGKPSTYAHGHNRRDVVVKDETRKKLSAKTTVQMRKKWGDTPRHPWMRIKEPEYVAWRNAVLERDSHTCQQCGKTKRQSQLHAHHRKSWNDFPDLRYTVENGEILCFDCHSAVHGWEVGKVSKPCACGCGELANPGRTWCYGHWSRAHREFLSAPKPPLTEEQRRKLGDALRGRKRPPEVGANISAAKKGRPIKGHAHTPESIEKLRLAALERYSDPAEREKTASAVRAAGDRKIANEPIAYCVCGCGTLLPPREKSRKQNRYIAGHQSKGKSPSEETRAKMSASAIKRCVRK